MLDEHFENDDNLPLGCNYEQFLPRIPDEY
jgi:hypothetical protein